MEHRKLREAPSMADGMLPRVNSRIAQSAAPVAAPSHKIRFHGGLSLGMSDWGATVMGSTPWRRTCRRLPAPIVGGTRSRGTGGWGRARARGGCTRRGARTGASDRAYREGPLSSRQHRLDVAHRDGDTVVNA